MTQLSSYFGTNSTAIDSSVVSRNAIKQSILLTWILNKPEIWSHNFWATLYKISYEFLTRKVWRISINILPYYLSVVAALEIAYFMSTGEKIKFSEQELTDCYNNGCTGGDYRMVCEDKHM